MPWVVTDRLAHLYRSSLGVPWPFSIHGSALEEARVELLIGELLSALEPAARRLWWGAPGGWSARSAQRDQRASSGRRGKV